MSIFLKAPDDRIDYVLDFSGVLDGDTISGEPTWTVQSGITNYATDNDETSATIWLSGGTHGVNYSVECEITTTGGRIIQRQITIMVRANAR